MAILRAAAQVENLLGVIGQNPAGGGQGDFGAQAIEQRRVQFLFELAHLRAHRRLGAEAGLRGLRKALQAHDFEKRMELIEVHGSCAVTRMFHSNRCYQMRHRDVDDSPVAWLAIGVVMRLCARLAAAAQNASNVLLVINDNSSLSRDIGEYYARRRDIPLDHVCRIRAATGGNHRARRLQPRHRREDRRVPA